MQPLHATEDMHFAEARLGKERLKGAYIWKTLLENDVVVVATGNKRGRTELTTAIYSVRPLFFFDPINFSARARPIIEAIE
jgi:hypothetical protein